MTLPPDSHILELDAGAIAGFVTCSMMLNAESLGTITPIRNPLWRPWLIRTVVIVYAYLVNMTAEPFVARHYPCKMLKTACWHGLGNGYDDNCTELKWPNAMGRVVDLDGTALTRQI
jgi:hypothetical protein